MRLKEFTIPFSGLKLGDHRFAFRIEGGFFEAFEYSEFNTTSIDVQVLLKKMGTTMELDMEAKGAVSVNCDLTNEPFDQPISSDLRLVVKFGEEYNAEDDEILIIPHGEHQINIAQYIFEMLVLAVPQKRVHPGVTDGTLKSELLDRLEDLRPNEQKRNDDNTDPRWDGLKKLLTDK